MCFGVALSLVGWTQQGWADIAQSVDMVVAKAAAV